MPVQKITKEEIILKAAGIFRRRGYYNTSMSDLAEECGLTKGLFYHYFASKEELMTAVLDGVHQHFKRTLFATAYGQNLAPEEKLEKFLGKAKRMFIDTVGGCLMGNIALETISTEPEFAPYLRRFFGDWVAALASIYEATYQPETAQTIAEQVVQEFEGAVMFMRVFGDKRYLDEVLERATARLQPG